MAGVYIHVPFCKKRCNYCDFYKTTNISLKNRFVESLLCEITHRYDFLTLNRISTIYFGGGTPSVLNVQDLNLIFNRLKSFFDFQTVCEITLEVNPDDFTVEWGVQVLNETPVNRLSFGLQSLDDQQLRLMGRRHNSMEGIRAIGRAFELGFKNVTVDLIYGLPGMTLKQWSETLDKVLDLPVKHLSAYHLTYEEGTPFYKDLQRGNLYEIDDSESVKQFEILVEKTGLRGMFQYEISNFAYPGFESKHNSGYWTGDPYLGLGPSAHSFWNNQRRWNLSDVQKYISRAESGDYFETETLSRTDRYNEIVMLGLRTTNGLDLQLVKDLGAGFIDYLFYQSQALINDGKLLIKNNRLIVDNNHRFLTDGIIQQLFKINDALH